MSQDFRINAQVRSLLVRLNVDLAKVEYGATNGVVYVRGDLRNSISYRVSDENEGVMAEIAFVRRVEKSVRKVPGVRDVVMKLENMVKQGARWKRR